MQTLYGYLTGIGYGVICLIISLVLYKFGIPRKYTRKVVHILVGFEWIFLYHFFGSGPHFLAVCLFFLLLMVIAYKGNLMPMISSDSDNAPGTVYYAVAMTGVAIVGCFVPEVMLPFGVGIFCTSIGDGLAGFVGQLVVKCNPKVYGNKTLLGAVANFVMSFLSASLMSLIFDMGLSVWHSLAIATLSMLLELITGFGFDNITITWGVTALTYGFMYFSGMGNYIVPILVTPLIIAFALAKRALTYGGVAVAVIMDIVISLALGNFGFVLLTTFFVGSIVIDKIKRKKKDLSSDDGMKGDRRDYMQVIANGLIPTLSALLFYVSGRAIFICAFVASLAEAFSDTVASGIGAFSARTFDPFRMSECSNGLSGGMSLLGTLASLIAAVVIGLVALAFGATDIWMTLIAVGSGFVGAVFDSFLGSVFQVKYKCRICDKITEKEAHCGCPTDKYSGLSLIDNDIVNLLSALFAAALSVTVCFLL